METSPNVVKSPERLRTFKVAAVALGYWLVMMLLAFRMTGGGHGWHAPAAVTFFSVVALPFVGVARLYRDRKLAIILAVIALVFDTLLLFSLRFELSYFSRTWRFSGVFVLMWAALWVGWQCYLVLILVQKGIRVDVTGLSRR